LARKIKVEFLALVPTMFSHCQHCMDLIRASGLRVYSEQLNEYPAEITETLRRVSELAQRVVEDFPASVELRVIDLASSLGLLKSLRHRVGSGPAVLINGRKAFRKLPDYNSLRVELLKAGAEQCWVPDAERQSQAAVDPAN